MNNNPLNDVHTLSHTTWNCKYHIVFAPKYRRKVFYGEKRLEIGAILRELCEWKGVKIITAEVCPDHVHICLYQALWGFERKKQEAILIVFYVK